MTPSDVYVVAGRILFVELEIADQSRARVKGFQQIVAEHRVVGKATTQRTFKGIYIVDAFADKGPFAENVLVYVRNGTCVRIYAGIAGKQADEPRASGAGQAH